MCKTCEINKGKKRRGLEVFVSHDAVRGIKLLNSKIECAQQALAPNPAYANAPKEIVAAFVDAAVEALANYRMMQQEWWDDARKANGIPLNVDTFVDFETGELFAME